MVAIFSSVLVAVTLAPFGEVKLIDEVDCTKSDHRFEDYPKGASRVETIAGKSCRLIEVQAEKSSFLNWRIGEGKSLKPNGAYVLVIEYPDDKPRDYYIRNYAGVFPTVNDEEGNLVTDFQIQTKAEVPNTVNLVGINSPGLTSSLPIARRVIDEGPDVFYTTVTNLISDFEVQKFGHSAGNETGLGTSQYFDCDLLIVDDLGTEIINQFTATVLYNVINTRISRKKSTIINTNFSRDELRAKYADRITSRLFGEYRVIPFVGRDVRMGKMGRR